MAGNDFGKARVVAPPLAPPLLPTGHLVAGRYEIIRLIGAGGAGEVYETFDSGLGVNVALKVLNPIHAQNAVQLERRDPGPFELPHPLAPEADVEQQDAFARHDQQAGEVERGDRDPLDALARGEAVREPRS